MKKILYITFIISLLISTAQAQQLPLSSLYNVNKFQINSAYAGFNNCVEGYLSHRSQWVGIDGAPTTQYLSVHSGIGKNMGLGANIVYDKTDIISKFSGALSFAYRVKLGEEHNLRFGISAGLYQISTTPSDAIVSDVTDDIVVSGNQSSMAFNNEFSLYYNYKKLEIGISIPQLLETDAGFDLASTNGGFGFKRHIVSTVGYDFDLSEKLSFQPSILYRTFNGSQNQIDFNGQITYNKLIFIGAGFRTDAGLLARLGMNIKDMFTIAYAYEFASGDIGSTSNGSHEIMLGIKFCKDKKEEIADVTPDPEPVQEPPVIEDVVEEVKEIEPVIIEDVVEIVENVEVEEEKPTEIDKSLFDVKIPFLLGEKSFDSSYNTSLDKIAKTMKENPELNLEVIGHSCDLGTAQIKENISKQRAKVVKAYLVKKGVNANKISTKGVNDSQQTVPNTSETNRQKNRRVEFIVK